MEKQKVVVSISGGETSAMMAYIFHTKLRHKYELLFVFANTSREKEETLIFLNNIKKYWGIDIVWVEAVIHHEKRKGTTHKVVDFDTAMRNGEVFEEVIKKYGIPNPSFPHCTRELKTNAINSYVKSIGWKDYKTAIGYRADEPKRINWNKEKTHNHLYILPRLNIKKPTVKNFFKDQLFQLGLKDYEGNCKLCYKKSKRKLLTQILDDPSAADWINEMEIKYGNSDTPAGREKIESKPFKFYRNFESIQDLQEEVRQGNFDVWKDDYFVEFNIESDFEEECSESCEPF